MELRIRSLFRSEVVKQALAQGHSDWDSFAPVSSL